jgi:group II intron reverse transcriptase/maturase
VIDASHLTNKPRSELTSEERLQLFQFRLYCKAKQDKGFRFYVLYDKLYLGYLLKEAWSNVRKNRGAAGYDGMSIEDVESYGVDTYLSELAEELKRETYKPQPVLRVYIPKANGKKRPLGIPTVKDRIAQMCCKLVIEPIFEADFEECSYGFRPNRSAHDAVRRIRVCVDKEQMREVYDADLSGYFDNIPHDKLMYLVEQRITDRRILKLIRLWLKTPVFENNKLHKSNKGTPQGGVISPLLANIYLNLIDKAVSRKDGQFHRYGVRIVRYADDFILMAKRMPQECIAYLHAMLQRMELEVNQEKTRLINVQTAPFDFLGFTFRYDMDIHGGKHKYLNIVPCKKSGEAIRAKIRDYLYHNRHKNPTELVKNLNPILRGWMNYYTIPQVSYTQMEKRKLRWYLVNSLYRYYRRKSQRKSKLYHQNACEVLMNKYNLVNPIKYSCV